MSYVILDSTVASSHSSSVSVTSSWFAYIEVRSIAALAGKGSLPCLQVYFSPRAVLAVKINVILLFEVVHAPTEEGIY